MSDAKDLAVRLVSGVLARTESGAQVAIPWERGRGQGQAVAVRTAENVVLRIPERDVEIYSRSQKMVAALLDLAGRLSLFGVVEEQAKEEGLSFEAVRGELAKRDQRFDAGRLFLEVKAAASDVAQLGDELGRFVAVDGKTRELIDEARIVAIDLQELVELGYFSASLRGGPRLSQTVRSMRVLAAKLQGEIGRRIGT